jgi:hypothetical protein
MSLHENKTCARCGQSFECKPFDIGNCQCSAVQLTSEERHYLQSQHDDCLCINCLKAIKQELFESRMVAFKKRTPFS